MEIELMGGPADGTLVAVPDETKLWVIDTPETDLTQFRVAESDLPNTAVPVKLGNHAYAITEFIGQSSRCRVFKYVGERVKQ